MRDVGARRGLERESDWVRGEKKADSVRACEIVSKSISRVEAGRRDCTLGAQVGSVVEEREGQSLWVR